MYKAVSNMFMIGAFGLLVVTIAKPDAADRVADRVLGAFTQLPSSAEFALSQSSIEPLIPSAVPTYLRTLRPAVSLIPISDAELAAVSISNIVDATNRERISAGLSPLVVNSALTASAKIKADDMVTLQYFEHESPNGRVVSDLATTAGYDYVAVAENLAYGDSVDGTAFVKRWMDSSGHRANILNPKYKEIGVYVEKGVYEGRSVWFAVQHFGADRSNCPPLDTGLRDSIEKIKRTLAKEQESITLQKALLTASDRVHDQEFFEAVTALNTQIAEYNTSLVLLQEKINQYNPQTIPFNTCVNSYK